MNADIGPFFDRYEWSWEQLESNVWRSTFATERDEEFDLYVMVGDEWIHFGISPFLDRIEENCATQLHAGLLALNQLMRLVYFAVDEDGDVNLLAELPRQEFTYHQFALTLDTMVHYTKQLAHDLQRLAREPGYHSRLVAE